jgi:outer membrane biosynthesis protein TonB
MERIILGFVLVCCLGDPVRAGERVVARVVSMEYPDLAVQARMQGELVVECLIEANGQGDRHQSPSDE